MRGYSVSSCVPEPGPLLLQLAMPFSIACRLAYIWLVPMISPLRALSTKHHWPAVDVRGS